ncbi:MAG: hypothetical protein RIR25_783 [Verrucomicrobiota bacterium]|jgi:predicted esterase
MLFRFEAGSSPALLLLHGTGGDENDLLGLGKLLRPGAALLSPRGEVLENGQPRFFRRLAPGIFDEQDLIRRTHDLADFVEDQRERQGLGHIIAVGYSNGANIAASMLVLRPGVLAGAILFRAMAPLELTNPPQLDSIPVLIIAGRSDEMVSADQPQRLATLLIRGGTEVTLAWQDAGHGIGPDDFQLAADWLEKHFGPGEG